MTLLARALSLFLAALAGCEGGNAPAKPPQPVQPSPSGPQVLDPALRLAHKAIEVGQHAAARVELERYLASPEAAHRGQAECLFGVSFFEQDLHAQASPHFARAAELEPDWLATHYYRGRSALELGQLGEARASLERFLAASPDHPAANFALGLVAIEEDRPEEARTRIQRAIELTEKRLGDPARAADARRDSGRYHARLGDVLVRLEQLPEARAALERAVALVPDLPEPWSKLQRVLLRLGDEEGARKAEERWRAAEAARKERR